jgi:hypothetical protein
MWAAGPAAAKHEPSSRLVAFYGPSRRGSADVAYGTKRENRTHRRHLGVGKVAHESDRRCTSTWAFSGRVGAAAYASHPRRAGALYRGIQPCNPATAKEVHAQPLTHTVFRIRAGAVRTSTVVMPYGAYPRAYLGAQKAPVCRVGSAPAGRIISALVATPIPHGHAVHACQGCRESAYGACQGAYLGVGLV